MLSPIDRVVRALARLRERRSSKSRREDGKEKPSARAKQTHHHDLKHRLIVSLAIGIVIEAALIVGHALELPVLTRAEDAAMDFVMRQFRNVKGNEHTAFVLLEADQASFETWEQPLYIHRDRVLDMIKFASGFELETTDAEQRQAIPALIVVDIELNQQGDAASADKLQDYLRRYSESSNPPLLLVRTLNTANPSYDGLPRERPSFLDAVVDDDKNENIFWSSPHFQLDDDYRIRRWILWLRTRDGAKLSSLPSVQLLSQVLLSESGSETAMDRYFNLINKLNNIESCGLQEREATSATLEVARGATSHEIDLCHTRLAQRLIYSIPYSIPEGQLRPKVDDVVPNFERVSAHEIDQMDRNFLANRVIMIGGTYRESRDWHATPIGEMPGAAVLVNAIHSLGSNGLLEPPPALVKILVVVPLILLMAGLFAWLNSFLAYLAASFAVLALLVPLSFFFFSSGIWLDFAIPLVAVLIHECAAEFEAIKHQSATQTAGIRGSANPESVGVKPEDPTGNVDEA